MFDAVILFTRRGWILGQVLVVSPQPAHPEVRAAVSRALHGESAAPGSPHALVVSDSPDSPVLLAAIYGDGCRGPKTEAADGSVLRAVLAGAPEALFAIGGIDSGETPGPSYAMKHQDEVEKWLREALEAKINEKKDRDHSPAPPQANAATTGPAPFLRTLPLFRNLFSKSREASIEAFHRDLLAANVALKTADALRDAVKAAVKTTAADERSVRHALRAAIAQKLLPMQGLGLRPRLDAGGLTTLALVGPNGAGKSTTIAKIATWARAAGHGTLIAACDTYRSGAIEQLRVHAERLGVTLVERGYGTDPAQVALAAKRQAQPEDRLLLVDTAGRMHHNATLMAELDRVVRRIKPDLVILVAEALAGGSVSLQQAEAYHRALQRAREAGHGLDGIILTKFDAVEQRAGALLSTSAQIRVPVVGIGYGQAYADLKLLEPDDQLELILDLLCGGK